MATVNLSPVGNGFTFFGSTGLPLNGGLIYTYQGGSSTPLATYTDNGGAIPNTNPIVLNSAGQTPSEVWMIAGYSYKFQIQTSAGVIVQTLDNLYGIPTSSGGGGGASVPTGCILIWSGSAGSIPSGFLLCDGTNGTPDLRNSFVIGAGNNYVVGQVGGSADAVLASHTHTATSVVTDPGHTHIPNVLASNPNFGSTLANGMTNAFATSTTNGPALLSATTGITVATTNSASGVSPTGGNLPPYYALCYIQKT
jgi:hypothetical protein